MHRNTSSTARATIPIPGCCCGLLGTVIPSTERGDIIPADAPSPKDVADFRDKAISLRRFGEFMREASAKHVLAIFDSCFSGTEFNVARSLPPPAITLATTQPVREFISSGEAEQTVSDDGTFRRLFLDALAGKEPDADPNHDGYVTGTELGLFLHQKMTTNAALRQAQCLWLGL
jgi:hypothetical protein